MKKRARNPQNREATMADILREVENLFSDIYHLVPVQKRRTINRIWDKSSAARHAHLEIREKK